MELNEQEAHCIARILQSALFGGQGIFEGCQYCKYQCAEGEWPRFQTIRFRLTDETGVDLGYDASPFLIGSQFPYHKFLKNSNEEVKEYFRTRFADYLCDNSKINGQ